jgi:hypothetical protein
MTWNANGILGKLGEVKVFLKFHKAIEQYRDSCCLQPAVQQKN